MALQCDCRDCVHGIRFIHFSSGADELINHVHVWQFDINFPDYDGWYDAGATNKGDHRNAGYIQSHRWHTGSWTEDCLFLG